MAWLASSPLMFVFFLLAVGQVSSQIGPGGVGSCRNRCGARRDSSKLCQCYARCSILNECCFDYDIICGRKKRSEERARRRSSKKEFKEEDRSIHPTRLLRLDGNSNTGAGSGRFCDSLDRVTEYFYNNDINRISSSDISVQWQTQVPKQNTEDRSPNYFFSSVDRQEFNSRDTFMSFVDLLNNYDPIVGNRDHYMNRQEREMDRFYDHIRSTDIFNKLYAFLHCKGHVSSDSDFKEKFYEMWFNLYTSSGSGKNDSCGFERVFVGQLDTSSSPHRVIGFHNWITFYTEQRALRVNYYGYVKRQLNQPMLGGLNFRWRPNIAGRHGIKSQGNMFIGTSPEFELALYTVCAFEHPTGICSVRLKGNTYRIEIDELCSKPGLQIKGAYPRID